MDETNETIKWRTLIIIWLVALVFFGSLTIFEPAPGYMDAEYYTATGMILAQGGGFNEPFFWNYLADPVGLPQSSHAHWMPLASLVGAAGMALTGKIEFSMARVSFLLISSFIPPLTTLLSMKLCRKRRYGILAGLLALFPGFYLPYLITTETFGLYALLGTIFLLLAGSVLNHESKIWVRLLGLGLTAGLMHLSRSDGILWAAAAVGIAIWARRKSGLKAIISGTAVALGGYLLVMGGWYARNWIVWGGFFPIGNSRMLFLTGYNDLFSYPASILTLTHWWEAGLGAALNARLDALWLNLKTAVGVQGMIVILPLILLGVWKLRKDDRVKVGGLLWLGSLAIMTIVFPFAGSRGGFFHAGAALQPLWFALTPIGLDTCLDWGVRKRNWKPDRAWRMFTPALVVLTAIFSLSLFYSRVIGSEAVATWQQDAQTADRLNEELERVNVSSDDVVMINNPPGLYVETRRPSIVIPNGGPAEALAAGQRYGATVLILEYDHPEGWNQVYENPDVPIEGFSLISKVDGAFIYALNP